MGNKQYLKEETYYTDLYDLQTIRLCLRAEDFWRETYQKGLNDPKLRHIPEKEKIKGLSYAWNTEIYVIQGERYRNKKSQIQEWMDRDRKQQEFFDTPPEPKNVTCQTCGKRMSFSLKTLESYLEEKPRVLFFFSCENCKKKRAIYDNGEEHVSKPTLCPNCNSEVSVKVTTESKEKVTWDYKCPSCKHKWREIDDFESRRIEWAKKEAEEVELLTKYREKHCLTDEVGQKYIWTTDQMARAVEELKDREEHKEDYDKLAKIKKLTVTELEALLIGALSKAGYIRLNLSNPQLERQIVVQFNVQDSNSSHTEYQSKSTLKKLIETTLSNTNWRLMSEGINYRLGFLSGRLKGYESDEDLLNLLRNS